MSWNLYLAYVVACAVLLAIPGPTVMLIVSYALAQGRRAAVPVLIGVGLGDVTAVVASFLGLGALLAASAALFEVVKWIGAAYLVWLGIRLWLAKPEIADADPAQVRRSGRSMLLHCWIVTALNPKGIMFFMAFVPQFLDPALPLLPQLTLLGITFVVLALGNAWAYAWLAGTARDRITRPSVLRTVNRVGGSLLIGAGLLTAAMRRTA